MSDRGKERQRVTVRDRETDVEGQKTKQTDIYDGEAHSEERYW